jgi:hypothetical protein
MPFQRPKPIRSLDKTQRATLLQSYFDHYREAAKNDVKSLNQKIPREAFECLLDRIGCILLDHAHATAAADAPGTVRDFLKENPLPKALDELLPDDFRIYCLALNALKQWLAAEQAATDRYLLGGKAREECLAVATTCVVTGESLDAKGELHHPVRDGRPPIPLSKRGHDRLEGQVKLAKTDSLHGKIWAIRKKANRSWAHLRKGCLDLLGREANHSTPKVADSSRSFGRKVSKETGLTYEQILAWLDEKNLGVE